MINLKDVITCVYFNSLLECDDQNGMFLIWNGLKKECVLFGMCSKQNVPFFWNVLKKMCPFGNKLFLESAQNKMSPFWNVHFLECDENGMCSKSRRLILDVSSCRPPQDRRHRSQILAVWSKTDLQPLKQNLCLASDSKKVKAKSSLNSLGITAMVLDNQ